MYLHAAQTVAVIWFNRSVIFSTPSSLLHYTVHCESVMDPCAGLQFWRTDPFPTVQVCGIHNCNRVCHFRKTVRGMCAPLRVQSILKILVSGLLYWICSLSILFSGVVSLSLPLHSISFSKSHVMPTRCDTYQLGTSDLFCADLPTRLDVWICPDVSAIGK
jgi:hypothetical protein